MESSPEKPPPAEVPSTETSTPPLSPTALDALFDLPLLEDDPPSPTMEAPFAHVDKPDPYKDRIIPKADGSGHFDCTPRSRPSRLSFDDIRPPGTALWSYPFSSP